MRRRSLLPAVLLIAPIALAACGGGSDWHPKLKDLRLVSAPPKSVDLDLGEPGPSVGDITTFRAELSKDGVPVGYLYGTKTLVALPGTDGAPEGQAYFLNNITFVLEDGTFSVGGIQPLQVTGDATHPYAAGNPKGDAVAERAITGGTGAYVGAAGAVRTSAGEGGSRNQEIDFIQ